MTCKNCNHSLHLVIADLGFAPPSNAFLKQADLESGEMYYPLKVYLCEKCLLVQIAEYKSAKEIFSKDYVYFSSFSSSWVRHAQAYVEMISKKLKLDSKSQVIEIASNDGYLLQFFNAKHIPNIGIEPTQSTAKAARAKGIAVIEQFFNSTLSRTLPKADLIIGNNVIAHVPDIRDFVRGVNIALKDNGVANFEFPHILNLIESNQFDTIYHEHFYYYSLHAIMNLFANEHLYIYDVETLPTHGGSLRIYASKMRKKPTQNIKHILALEKAHNLHKKSGYLRLQHNMEQTKNAFLSLLLRLKKQGQKVIAFGAAAKGNTLLNYCGIKKDLIACAIDSSPHKQNLLLPGSHIAVKDKSALANLKPDYIWIPAWNLKKEIMHEVANIYGGGGNMQIYNHLPKSKNYQAQDSQGLRKAS